MESSRFDQPQSRKSHSDQSETPKVLTKRFSQSQSRFKIKSLLAFSLVAGMSMFCQSALSMYNKSTMTSLERQFSISSSSTGLIASSFNIGNLLLTLPVASISCNNHRPRIMAFGILVTAIGGFINYLPHVLISEKNFKVQNNTTLLLNETTSTEFEFEKNGEITNYFLVFIIIMGEILQGAGSSFLLPLSTSYIDDFASVRDAPIYIGISLVVQNLGQGVGFLIGSWTSSKHVNFDVLSQEESVLTPEDTSMWIGAWWLGFLILSPCLLATAFPLLFFPTKIPSSENVVAEEKCQPFIDYQVRDSSEVSSEQNLDEKEEGRNLISTVKNLLLNKVYILLVFAYTGIMFTVATLTSFMPKYLEVVFSVTAQFSNLLFGVCLVAVTALGLLLGAFVLRLNKSCVSKILFYAAMACLVSIVPISSSLFFTCDHETDSVSSAADACSYDLAMFLLLVCTGAFIASSLVTVIYTAILRVVQSSDKVAGLSILFLIVRGLGMIPAPIMSGLVIDMTCKNWVQDENLSNSMCAQYKLNELRNYYIFILLSGMVLCLLFVVSAFLFHLRERKNISDEASFNR